MFVEHDEHTFPASAEAAAAALRPQLRGVQVTLQSRAYGEADPVAGNAT
jgi:hypothetical protein